MKISYNFVKKIIFWSKFFLIGLILQFFLHTFITFQLGFDSGIWSIIWMWKELIIFIFLVICGFFIIKSKKLKKLWDDIPLKGFIIMFFLTLLVILLITIFVKDISIYTYILSIKYTFSGFIIFIVFFLLGYLFYGFKNEGIYGRKTEKIFKWYTKLIKYLLIFGLMWRGIIWLIPRLLEFTGYNQHNFEGDIGERPPAVYYTQLNQGLVRNQFLFERPISRGFFLVVFRPLFFLLQIKSKSKHELFFWGGLYGLNVLSTFSRAAWITWILITLILILTQYRKNFWKLTIYMFVPILFLFMIITYYGKTQIINRTYSNTGHIKHVITALGLVKNNFWLGVGVGSAGPVTHIIEDIPEYNPENQLLQIWIEYGLIGFLGWFFMYFFLHYIGVKSWYKISHSKLTKVQREYSWILFALALGLFGLTIEGMVLHSFVDRMIVYPFCAIYGLAYSLYYKKINHLEITNILSLETEDKITN